MFGRSVGFFASNAAEQPPILWFDSSNPAGTGILPVDGIPIANWVNLGTGGNATQDDSDRWPTFKLNIQNSLPGIFFDPDTGSYSLSVASLAIESKLTLFVVSRCTNVLAPLFMEQSVDINSHNGFYLYGDGVNAQISKGGSYVQPTGSPNWLGTSTSLAMMTYDGSTISTWKNGSLFQTGSGSLADGVVTDQFFIASRGDTTLFFGGYLFEIRLYAGALSLPRIAAENSELNSKWAIY